MTASIIGMVVVAAIASVPLVFAACLWFWVRWLARKTPTPRMATRAGYAVVTLSCISIAWGFAMGLIAVSAFRSVSPGQKSRMLATGIAETMNGGAIGLMVALPGALWLGFCTWKWRERMAQRGVSDRSDR
jgi:hypothetical protein